MKHSTNLLVATLCVAITTIAYSNKLNAATFPDQENERAKRAHKEIEMISRASIGNISPSTELYAPHFSFLNCDASSMCFEINTNRKYTLSGNLQLQEDQICHRVPTHVASTFGFSFQHIRGWQTSVQYSFLDNGIESSSNVVLSRNLLPVDLNLSYQADRFSFGVSAENFLNMQWNLNKPTSPSRMSDAQTPLGWNLYFPELPYALTANVNFLF